MRRFVPTATVLLLSGAVVTTAAWADVPNRFDYIPKRNVFGLKPAPPPQEEKPNQPPPEKPGMLLTGITTILGDKRALFKTQPKAGQAQPGTNAPAEQSYILSEGQREGPIEVLKIDENAGAVSVNLNGDMRTLTLDRDGPKLPSSAPATPNPQAGQPNAAAAGQAAVPTFNVGGIPSPGVPGATPRPGEPTASTRTIPSRMPRLPQTGSSASAVYATNSGLPLPPPPVQTSPALPNTTPPAPTPNPFYPAVPPGMPQTERPQYTPEEQQMLLELQRLEAEGRAQ